MTHSITLVDGNDSVYCTQECIDERIKELNTICVEAPQSGKKPEDLKKANLKVVLHIGKNCDERVLKSYEKYADRVETKYNIKMEIRE